MNMSNFVRGLEILRSHYKNQDGHHLAAEHDQIFFYPTDTPLTDEEVREMNRLGFDQDTADDGYSLDDGWYCYV